MGRFSGKVAIVTGSSSGIGAATAIHFAELGASVTITGRKAENLEKTKAQCANAGAKVHTVVGDVTDEAVRKRIVDETIVHFKRLDFLVNNAGIALRNAASQGEMDKYDAIFNTNLRSVVHLTSLAMPHLKATKGTVVNVSSVAGLRPNTEMPFYAMSKAALDQYTRCLAMEVGPDGVRVNAVNPAAVDTPIFNTIGEHKEKFLSAMASTYPLRRIGQPEDVAAAIAFLCDAQAAGWITGVLLPLDGGSTITSASGPVMEAFGKQLAQAQQQKM